MAVRQVNQFILRDEYKNARRPDVPTVQRRERARSRGEKGLR